MPKVPAELHITVNGSGSMWGSAALQRSHRSNRARASFGLSIMDRPTGKATTLVTGHCIICVISSCNALNLPRLRLPFFSLHNVHWPFSVASCTEKAVADNNTTLAPSTFVPPPLFERFISSRARALITIFTGPHIPLWLRIFEDGYDSSPPETPRL